MNHRRVTLVILAQPGPVRDGLAALFTAVPAVSVAAEVGDLDGALMLLRLAPPDILVLDSALAPAALPAALERLRAAAPTCARLVLVDDVSQLGSVAPADVVLLKGASAAELVAAVQRLAGRATGYQP